MNFAIVTYTTSKYADVWPMHFGQLSEHASAIKSYAFSDDASRDLWNYPDHTLVTYDNSQDYWLQYTNCLESVPEDYIIYSQEDFILFDNVNPNVLQKYSKFLENSKYDYVKLIRCGFKTPLDKHVVDDIYEVDMSTKDAFAMQATMWKKSSMQKLYKHVKSKLWLESDDWNKGALDLKLNGTFIYNNEPQIGLYHYDSIVYPHVCTAINKGKWNVDQYPVIMNNLFKKYSINPNVRGIRVR